VIEAVLFDFGGVVTTSPFDAFARYERANDLPEGLIRTINSTNPDDNAWAKLERSDVDTNGFVELFEAEARQRGHAVDGNVVLSLIGGEVRPQMVEAIGRIKTAGFRTACVTNNFWGRHSPSAARPAPSELTPDGRHDTSAVMAMFDEFIESSVIGIRKPEIEFYRRALAVLAIEAAQAVYLDDLGINLKPAKAMGMTTIKVVDPDMALAELGVVLGLPLV
jgi:putative hydrolase of the HAD superfamily